MAASSSKSAQKEQVVVQLQVRMDKDAHEAILAEANPADPNAKLQSLARYFLEAHARGGITLPASVVKRIEQSTGRILNSPDDVVAAIQESNSRDGGQFRYPVDIDPAFHEPIEVRAKEQGWTVGELINNFVTYTLTEGWAYEFQPTGGKAYFKREDWAFLQQLLGQNHFTGTQLMEVLRAALKQAEAAEPAAAVA